MKEARDSSGKRSGRNPAPQRDVGAGFGTMGSEELEKVCWGISPEPMRP